LTAMQTINMEFGGNPFLSLTGSEIIMKIERNKNEITITVSTGVDSFGLQRLIDYMKYLETTSKSKAKQSEIDALAKSTNESWWTENRKRFVK